ncbi:hypothetical protein LEP3755_36280 [Leptolyngbya sp. NIES-3755]|nr:hypothetical protein LEP3755_36280 [Leptolyngbya sp. NIES-3755]
MASIKISELRPVGSELFQDSESFLNELNDRDLDIRGGGDVNISVLSQYSYSYGISILTQSVVTVKTYNSPKSFFF